MRISFLTLFVALVALFGDYKTGERIFNRKCSSCHAGFIALETVKKNFFEEENRLLKLEAPTVNMLTWAILEGPKRIGDPSHPEMQRTEIEMYIKDYMENPSQIDSICDPRTEKYYKKKKRMIGVVSDEKVGHIVDYIYGYRNNISEEVTISAKDKADIDKVVAYAKKTGKVIIVEAMTPTCYFCKWMDKEIFSDKEVQAAIEKDFILFKVDMKKNSLPLGLNKHYRQMTPSFYFLDPKGELLGKYRGGWNKKDFLQLMSENLAKK